MSAVWVASSVNGPALLAELWFKLLRDVLDSPALAYIVMLVFGFNTLGYLVYTNKRRDAPSWFGVDKVGRLCLDLRF